MFTFFETKQVHQPARRLAIRLPGNQEPDGYFSFRVMILSFRAPKNDSL
jgi:hypothetical protein